MPHLRYMGLGHRLIVGDKILERGDSDDFTPGEAYVLNADPRIRMIPVTRPKPEARKGEGHPDIHNTKE